MDQPQENRDLPSMSSGSNNSLVSNYSSADFSSHTSDSFNGFDHREAYPVNNANKADMLNHEQEFDTYQKRLATFLRWPLDSPIRPEILAAAGFYSGGLDDRVVCFKCGLHLRQWKAGDDPWTEHKRFRRDCPFVQECENANEVTCSPVEASANVQGPRQPSFAPKFPRFGDRTNLTEQHGGPLVDPKGLMYSERPQYATQGGRYGNQQQSYPIDTQTGFQQVYYPARTQDPSRPNQYQRPEHEQIGTERTQHVVVRQGSNQVHIVGSAVYRLNPEDKLYIHGGGQGYPYHVRSERDFMPVYPEAHQTSRLPSMPTMEASFTGSFPARRESSQYSSEEQMSHSGRHQLPQPSTVSYPPSYTGPFAKQLGYQFSTEKTSAENTAMFQEGSINPAKYMMQQCREGDKMEYGRDTLHESRASKQPFMTERKMSNEEGLLQENCYSPQAQWYPGTKSESGATDTRPSQPPQDRSNWQVPPGRNVQGSRRPSPGFAAFPVKDPSLQTAQRPLIRQEEERHVTSASNLSNEHHRLTTFVDWPHDHHIHPLDLSAAGFYYLGTGDSVKCYRCGIPLHNWDPTDTPWGEHKKWAPMCPLVLEHFSGRPHLPRQSAPIEQRVPNAQDEQRNRPEQSQGPNDGQMPFRSGNPSSVHGTWERSEQFPAHKVSNMAIRPNPSMEQQHTPWYAQPMTTSSEEGHMTCGRQTGSAGESGSCTSSQTTHGPGNCSPRGSAAIEFDMEKLAEMGFTERDINEVLTVQIETTGSPFSTYAELVSALLQRQQARAAGCESFPQSTPQGDERLPASPPLLTIPQGIAFPRLNEDFRERNCLSAVTSPTSPAPDKSSLRRTLSAPASRSSESDESLEERLERMQEERRCKICMDAELGVVFLPCGHLSCCAVCADGVEVCPMCRTPIREKIRTYLS